MHEIQVYELGHVGEGESTEAMRNSLISAEVNVKVSGLVHLH